MTIAEGNLLVAVAMYLIGALLIWMSVFEKQRAIGRASLAWWLVSLGLTLTWPIAVPITFVIGIFR